MVGRALLDAPRKALITSPYSALERWLHWIALQPSAVRHLAFDLERAAYLPDNPAQAALGPVYVCGLARSGTTILLRLLDEVEVLKSLSYRDMPFVLAPNLWRAAHGERQRNVAKTMRAHKDGLFVDLDSPEGLEEVFWHTFGHTVADTAARTLSYHPPSPDTLAAFADYRALVANPKGSVAAPGALPRRYLSKNNNNLMRLASLSADPSAHVLLVYRDPVATARSLHRQHQRFCKAQAGDRFVRRYMGWLAHYDFGLDHLPFAFARPHMAPGLQSDDPNYWLDYWCAVHQHILQQQAPNLHLVNYDTLCAQPARVLGQVFNTLALQADATALSKLVRAAPPSSAAPTKPPHPEQRTSEPTDVLLAPPTEFSPTLLQRAHTIHAALRASGRNIISE